MAPDEATPAEEARATPPASNPQPPAPRPANPTIAVDEPEPEPEPQPEPQPHLHDPGPRELRPDPVRSEPEPPNPGPTEPRTNPVRSEPEPEPQLRDPEPREPRHDPIRPARSDFNTPAGFATPSEEASHAPTTSGTDTPPKPANPTIAVEDREPRLRDPGPQEPRPDPITEPNHWEELYSAPEPPPEPRRRSRDTDSEPDLGPTPEGWKGPRTADGLEGWAGARDERETDETPSTASDPEQPRATTGTDALGVLLVKPMELDAGAIEDPVLRDRLCRVEAVGQCDPERAHARLELDRARGLFVPPDYERQSSPVFLEEEREQAEREAEARAEADGGFAVPGWVKETGGAIKGIGESVYRISPVNRRVDPESWQRENEEVGRGFVESAKGIKDSAVSIYRLSPQNRRSNPEDWARANAELGRTAQYAYENPWAFTKQVAGGMVNLEDLREGRYGEWLGGFGPDAIITAATWGTGTAVNGSLRGVRAGTEAIDTRPPNAELDTPDLDADSPDVDADLPTTGPQALAGGPAERLLQGLRADERQKIDLSSPDERRAFEGMERDTSAGTRRNTPRPGQFELNRTAGHGSEIRALLDLARRPEVTKVTPVPSSSSDRSPDFIVEDESGAKTRFEVKTITGVSGRPNVEFDDRGRPRNYQRRGVGRAQAPTPDAIKAAIRDKVAGDRTQFNVPFRDVPEGGVLSLHLRGPAAPGRAAAEEAIEKVRDTLAGAKVRVELNLTDKTVVRYTVEADGTITRELRPAR